MHYRVETVKNDGGDELVKIIENEIDLLDICK